LAQLVEIGSAQLVETQAMWFTPCIKTIMEASITQPALDLRLNTPPHPIVIARGGGGLA
jgi:hypothetical protein